MRLPRLALATSSTLSEPSTAALALLSGLSQTGWRVQHFRCHARPTCDRLVEATTGRASRHLDAWLMSPDVCRDVFARGMRLADIAVVEGTLDPNPDRACTIGAGGPPGRLCPHVESLDMAVVAVVDCRRDPIHLPHLDASIEAILLDGVRSPSHYDECRRAVECLSGLPVLSGIERTRDADPDELSEAAIACLGRSFLQYLDAATLNHLATSRSSDHLVPHQPRDLLAPLRIAYAQDAAFGVYDPDAIDRLEALGVELVEFSPLCSEQLPAGVDIVVIGCGHPEDYAEELAANVSLIAALRNHVCRGHRLYGEGAGAAYLGRSLVLPDRHVPMAGILPFDAILRDQPRRPSPVSRCLARDSWLGVAGTTVKGYRSGRWALTPARVPEDCPACAGVLTDQRDLYFRHHAIGSLIHLPLAALPDVVARFIGPHRPSIRLPSRTGHQPQ